MSADRKISEKICVSKSILLTIIKTTLEIPIVKGVQTESEPPTVQPVSSGALPPTASPAK